MKKVLTLVLGIIMLWMIAPVMAPPAAKTTVTGSFTGSATSPGEFWITSGGILLIRDAQGEGPVIGDLPGLMTFRESLAVNIITGDGTAKGEFVFSDAQGTFEGTFRTTHWGVVYYEGTAVAHGTDYYEGMILQITYFSGYNYYVGGLPQTVPDGVYFEFVGVILSPLGEPLP